MDNLSLWNKVKQVPPNMLKTIQAGRLKGKSDINPQWRYQAMTENFGICGIGWKYEIKRVWTEPAPFDQVFAMAEINLYIRNEDDLNKWSDPIPGIGGHMLVIKESAGLHTNDEGYKMAITDALSVAMKMLGFGADVYAGLWDGSKYRTASPEPPKQPSNQSADKSPTETTKTPKNIDGDATEPQIKAINTILSQRGITDDFERHKKVSELLALPETITSLSKLSKFEASMVIKALGEGK